MLDLQPRSRVVSSAALFGLPHAQVAQLVEQRTENPRVGGSIPSLGTTRRNSLQRPFLIRLRARRTLQGVSVAPRKCFPTSRVFVLDLSAERGEAHA